MPMRGSCAEGSGPNGEYTIDVEATNDVKYHYTFLEEDGGCFDVGNCYLADYFRSYGRCVVVIDQRVHDIYGDQVTDTSLMKSRIFFTSIYLKGP